MNAGASPDAALAAVAAAIGDRARARMLGCLLDGRARTSTELALIGGVAPSTASVHLRRLQQARLVQARAQGKHRYYSLAGAAAAAALEALSVLSGQAPFTPRTPPQLRSARTCYDHLAGALGVAWCDRLLALGWLRPEAGDSFDLSPAGAAGLTALGVELAALRTARRRFAFACLDWSERRPHLGGALGAALLQMALGRRWLQREWEGRAVALTRHGKHALTSRFGLVL